MVECFNGRIGELLKQTAEELEKALLAYLLIYNEQIPQRALHHQPPLQAVQKWQKDKPVLFVRPVYNHTGLDS